MPSADIALELPTTCYIRTVRSLLVVVTKTLAAYTVARVPRFHQIYTDGTTRRQTELINMLIGYVTDEGLKTVTPLTLLCLVPPPSYYCHKYLSMMYSMSLKELKRRMEAGANFYTQSGTTSIFY
eukprot:scaffold3764_cov66-Skeletonema_marinoi.AAC.4